MKYLSLVLSALALSSTVAFAANSVSDTGTSESSYNVFSSSGSIKPISRIIPQAGVSFGDATISDSSSRTGFLGGATVDLLGRGNLVLESGLLYKQLGTTFSNVTFNLNYMVIPVAAKYYFSGQHATSIYGVGGFMPGFNVSHTYTAKNGQSGDLNDIPGTTANTLDFELLLGVGGKLNLSRSTSLVLEFDYTRGLTNVLSQAGSGNPSVNNLGFALVTGVAIEL